METDLKRPKILEITLPRFFFIVINSGLFEVTVGEEQFVRDYSGKKRLFIECPINTYHLRIDF